MDKRMTNCEEESGKGSEPKVDLEVDLSFSHTTCTRTHSQYIITT